MSKIGKQEKTDTHIKQVVGSLLAKKEMKRHSKIGKFFVTNFTGTAITSTAALDAIFLPALGTTDITRVGDRAVVDYVKVKGYLDLNAGNLGSQYARLILFWWNQDDSEAAPTQADVLYNTFPYSNCDPDSLSKKKIQILWDKEFTAEPDWHGCQLLEVPSFRNLNKLVRFTLGATSGNGKLYLYAQSDIASASSPPKLYCEIMMGFHDGKE